MIRDPCGGQPARHVVGRGVRRRPGGLPKPHWKDNVTGEGEQEAQSRRKEKQQCQALPVPVQLCTAPPQGCPEGLHLWLLNSQGWTPPAGRASPTKYLPCLALGPPGKHPVQARKDPQHPQLLALVLPPSCAAAWVTFSDTARLALLDCRSSPGPLLSRISPHLTLGLNPSPCLPVLAQLSTSCVTLGKIHVLSVSVSLSVKW